MKYIKFCLILSVLFSCNQNEAKIKEMELALKNKELELKKQELEVKELEAKRGLGETKLSIEKMFSFLLDFFYFSEHDQWCRKLYLLNVQLKISSHLTGAFLFIGCRSC